MSLQELSSSAWRKSSHSGASEGSCVEVAAIWRKSSHSGGNEGSCVELAAAWRKSSHSGSYENNCVEVSPAERCVAVRDSKDPAGPVLHLAPAAWHALSTGIKAGVHDL
ncbi:DUF397 domain-containing protein [Thermomonospora cellulosilytica]|uniref:DUF397 domain-containing protein n=1 Tax=Thermomonospora cellulosilytica TaxID=1411118 RepID=UPI0016014D23|nr:DUF397 domain-containing protein [Thermomonospora cellulosilytica]